VLCLPLSPAVIIDPKPWRWANEVKVDNIDYFETILARALQVLSDPC